MIDLHTHSLLSDGVLLPTELIRRAVVKGYKVIGVTDHADASNIDFVVPRLANVCDQISAVWDINAIPGVELTHVPLEHFPELTRQARNMGALLVIGHGQTLAEPVMEGTNRAAIEARVDILAHPGLITPSEVDLAAKKGVCLEITSRKGHSLSNGHVARLAMERGAKLVFGTDTHAPSDLITREDAGKILQGAGIDEDRIKTIFQNAAKLVLSHTS